MDNFKQRLNKSKEAIDNANYIIIGAELDFQQLLEYCILEKDLKIISRISLKNMI